MGRSTIDLLQFRGGRGDTKDRSQRLRTSRGKESRARVRPRVHKGVHVVPFTDDPTRVLPNLDHRLPPSSQESLKFDGILQRRPSLLPVPTMALRCRIYEMQRSVD
jgi:hypothetical protein